MLTFVLCVLVQIKSEWYLALATSGLARLDVKDVLAIHSGGLAVVPERTIWVMALQGSPWSV